tara:strand:+ start:209 stop:1156 length:948 start_codon:yes stop_codon:yes gene_type:complete
MNYKDAGVDVEAGNAFVEQLKKEVPSIGGFGGMFEVPRGYEEPVLVSGADGVGTKINIARIAGDYTTIGIDLVAMCVNDVITCGAKPLYFLDYVSTRKIDDKVADIMVGILKGCEIAGVELIGGETAEHFRQKEYDLAGFCTGIVEKSEIINGSLVKRGDVIIGIESSGLHSNGYTLINDMLWRHKITFNHSHIGKPMPELLTPTTIYSPLVKDLRSEVPILGMAHITGGGIPGNLPRCIPSKYNVKIDYNSWPIPELFSKIMLAGEIPEEDMINTFNMGIGYCLIVPEDVAKDTKDIISKHNLKSWVIGEVVTD